MNNLSSYLIGKIFNLPVHQSWITNIQIPSKTFGVFVTVLRSDSKNKNDVHGCIGYWDPNYKIQSKDKLLTEIVRVGKSAVFKDSRSKRFDPIINDPFAKFIISWMIQPLYPIDIQTGFIKKINKKFNNQMGIIVQSYNNRATYLPNVFTNESWEQVINSLMRKGNISSKDPSVSFYGYMTEEIEFDFFKSFTGNPFCMPYLSFLSSQNSLPYQINKNGKILSDDEQWVRNLAVIEGLLQLPCYQNKNKNPYQSVVDQALSIFDSNPQIIRQALSSVIELVDKKDKKNICQYLLSDLYQGQLESDFEEPQILISIVRNCDYSNVFGIIEKRMTNGNRSIFRLNWDTQLLSESISIWKGLKQYMGPIDQSVSKIVDKYSNKTMTNELAVAFECICALMNMNPNVNSMRYLMKLILLLWQRWDPKTGLYKFLDGDERVDIANHVLHGQNILFHFR